MTETSWASAWVASASAGRPAARRADTVAAGRAAADVNAAIARVSAARPVEWVAPSVAVYLDRLREIRDAGHTAHELIETVRYRATVFNQVLDSEPARSVQAEG
ncbi:MAG: hypothetical protein LBK59_09125 [Bifidobacteriaceae bacterium]|nr:hypothetical protein [Bifidobacteriaceae bacterium]